MLLQICQDKVAPELMESYLKVRAERWLNLTSYVFSKWNISVLFDETGKTIRMDPSNGRPLIKPVERVIVNATHPHRQYFEQVRFITLRCLSSLFTYTHPWWSFATSVVGTSWLWGLKITTIMFQPVILAWCLDHLLRIISWVIYHLSRNISTVTTCTTFCIGKCWMILFPHILLFPLIISFIAYPNCIFLTGAYSSNWVGGFDPKKCERRVVHCKRIGLHPVLNWQEHWLFNWSFLVQKRLMSGMNILF